MGEVEDVKKEKEKREEMRNDGIEKEKKNEIDEDM